MEIFGDRFDVPAGIEIVTCRVEFLIRVGRDKIVSMNLFMGFEECIEMLIELSSCFNRIEC